MWMLLDGSVSEIDIRRIYNNGNHPSLQIEDGISVPQLQQATNSWMFVANRHLEIQQISEAGAICCRDALQVGLDGQPVMMCWLIELELSIKRRRLMELSQLRLSRMMCSASCERGSF